MFAERRVAKRKWAAELVRSARRGEPGAQAILAGVADEAKQGSSLAIEKFEFIKRYIERRAIVPVRVTLGRGTIRLSMMAPPMRVASRRPRRAPRARRVRRVARCRAGPDNGDPAPHSCEQADSLGTEGAPSVVPAGALEFRVLLRQSQGLGPGRRSWPFLPSAALIPDDDPWHPLSGQRIRGIRANSLSRGERALGVRFVAESKITGPKRCGARQ
jgi:hypothetical protein